jgi:uncharacterized glyoxalase superfamily protein PhnB
MAVKGSVPTPEVIVPHLVVRDAAEAVDFYTRAFSAEVLYRSPLSERSWRAYPHQNMELAHSGLNGRTCAAERKSRGSATCFP